MRTQRRDHIICLTGCALLAACGVAAAQAPPPRLELRADHTTQVPSLSATPVMSPVFCDGDGNIYMRGYAFPNPAAAPVTKIYEESGKTVALDMNAVPGLRKNLPLEAYGVGQKGEVYVLVFPNADELDLVEFDDDGKYDATEKLELMLQPFQLVPFASGELLVAGEKLGGKDQPPTGEPLTAIFDRNGKLLKILSLPGKAKKAAGFKPQAGGPNFDPSLSLGVAESSDDGNIYLMRATASPVIRVISPGGETLRTLKVQPPTKTARALALKAAGGKVIIEFGEPAEQGEFTTTVYSQIDALTGKTEIEYTTPASLGGAFACYTPNGFEFLSSAGGHLTIVHASPH